MALVSGGGPGTPQPGGGTTPFADAGYVLEQYTYDPYGSAVANENFDIDAATGKSLHAVNRVGHQGLFFERFDGSYIDQTLAEGGLPGLTTNAQATGLYYNRNRWYSPSLGGFTSRDPNQTGLPVIAALAMNGRAVGILLGGFNGQGLYGDGMNLYLYAGANPVMNTDPSGEGLIDMEYGREVHRQIGADFKRTYGVWGYYDKSINTILGTRSVFGVFRPDLVLRNAGGGEVWEIKSVGEAPLGAVEVVYKSLILNALDPAGGTWVAGSASSYMPPPILDLGAGVIAFVFPPVGGVITYQVLDLKPIVAAVVLYGLCELYSMLAYVEAQPVLAPATCGIL